jgi:hypothetical protein
MLGNEQIQKFLGDVELAKHVLDTIIAAQGSEVAVRTSQLAQSQQSLAEIKERLSQAEHWLSIAASERDQITHLISTFQDFLTPKSIDQSFDIEHLKAKLAQVIAKSNAAIDKVHRENSTSLTAEDIDHLIEDIGFNIDQYMMVRTKKNFAPHSFSEKVLAQQLLQKQQEVNEFRPRFYHVLSAHLREYVHGSQAVQAYAADQQIMMAGIDLSIWRAVGAIHNVLADTGPDSRFLGAAVEGLKIALQDLPVSEREHILSLVHMLIDTYKTSNLAVMRDLKQQLQAAVNNPDFFNMKWQIAGNSEHYLDVFFENHPPKYRHDKERLEAILGKQSVAEIDDVDRITLERQADLLAENEEERVKTIEIARQGFSFIVLSAEQQLHVQHARELIERMQAVKDESPKAALKLAKGFSYFRLSWRSDESLDAKIQASAKAYDTSRLQARAQQTAVAAKRKVKMVCREVVTAMHAKLDHVQATVDQTQRTVGQMQQEVSQAESDVRKAEADLDTAMHNPHMLKILKVQVKQALELYENHPTEGFWGKLFEKFMHNKSKGLGYANELQSKIDATTSFREAMRILADYLSKPNLALRNGSFTYKLISLLFKDKSGLFANAFEELKKAGKPDTEIVQMNTLFEAAAADVTKAEESLLVMPSTGKIMAGGTSVDLMTKVGGSGLFQNRAPEVRVKVKDLAKDLAAYAAAAAA